MSSSKKRQGALAKSSAVKNTDLIDELISDMRAIKELPSLAAAAKTAEDARKAASVEGVSSTVFDSTARIAASAAAAHARLAARAASLQGRNVYFARVVKNLGPYFLLTLVAKDAMGKERVFAAYGSPMGRLKQKKAQIRFSMNDVVIIEGFIPPQKEAEKQIITVEMSGIVGKNQAIKLYEEGLMHSNVLPEDEQKDPTLFDYGEGEQQEEEESAGGGGGKGKRGDKKSAVLQQELDIDPDDL